MVRVSTPTRWTSYTQSLIWRRTGMNRHEHNRLALRLCGLMGSRTTVRNLFVTVRNLFGSINAMNGHIDGPTHDEIIMNESMNLAINFVWQPNVAYICSLSADVHWTWIVGDKQRNDFRYERETLSHWRESLFLHSIHYKWTSFMLIFLSLSSVATSRHQFTLMIMCNETRDWRRWALRINLFKWNTFIENVEQVSLRRQFFSCFTLDRKLVMHEQCWADMHSTEKWMKCSTTAFDV